MQSPRSEVTEEAYERDHKIALQSVRLCQPSSHILHGMEVDLVHVQNTTNSNY